MKQTTQDEASASQEVAKTSTMTSTLAKLSLEVEDSSVNYSSTSISPGARNFQNSSSGSLPPVPLRKFKHAKPFYPSYTKRTNIEMSNVACDDEFFAQDALGGLLRDFILKKCNVNPHCRKTDFDGTALDGLNRLFFIQSLQAIEHYASSVSERIQKKPAYLMGILRGQESHWDNSRAAANLDGGSMQLLNLPGRVLKAIGEFCLDGNTLPSDFTPEVLLSLHSLTVELAIKAIEAFNNNKRIVAGVRGGVVNRPRFLQRLIENVIQQNPLEFKSIATESEDIKRKEDIENHMMEDKESVKSFCSLLGASASNEQQLITEENKLLKNQNSILQCSLQEKEAETDKLKNALSRLIESYQKKCKEAKDLENIMKLHTATQTQQ